MYPNCKEIGCIIMPLPTLLAGLGTAAPVFAGGATRDLPDCYRPGVALTVSIAVDTPAGTPVWGLNDWPPAGWTVDAESISHGGTYDSENHKVKWGPYFDDLSRTVTYEITPPVETTGEQCFGEGVITFGGPGSPIEGDACVFPPGRGDSDEDCDVDLGDYAMFADCLAGPATSPDPTPPTTMQDCLDVFDFDGDDDVDMFDAAEFEAVFTGG